MNSDMKYIFSHITEGYGYYSIIKMMDEKHIYTHTTNRKYTCIAEKQIHIYTYTYIVTRPKIFIPGRVFIFRTCEDGAAWHLIPRKISSS